jgi:hypothetical protein
MCVPAPTNGLVRWVLAILWVSTLAMLLGCGANTDAPDPGFLRWLFLEQADAILRGPFAFAPGDNGFEAPQPPDGHDGVLGEGGLHVRFPWVGDGDLRFALPDGSEVRVRNRCDG